MGIKTYCPEFSVLVYKTIARADDGQPERLQGGGQPWDITPYLGDGSDISIAKSVESPMGSFVITVPDQPYAVQSGVSDTLYGLLEPMDEIDIRLAHRSADYPDKPPVLMRGFIRSIRRLETISSEGKPQRTVVIQGNDYGWLFEITQLPPLPYLNYGLGLPMFTAWDSFMTIGTQQKPRPIGEFFQLILDNMVNKQAQTMNARFTIKLDNPQNVYGTVVIPTQNAMAGPIWNTLVSYADTPWNELFLDDPETTADDPPRLRFRTAPYKTWIKNKKILTEGEIIKQQEQEPPVIETVEIDIRDLVRLDASRSEKNVANLYWVPTGYDNHMQISASMQQAAANGVPGYMFLDGDDYPNSDPDLYCYRLMNRQSMLLSSQQTTGINGQSEQDLKSAGGLLSTLPPWATGRRKGLVEMNCDNVLLEEGTMTLKGNERIRAGKYIVLSRGNFVAEYYAKTVMHRFAPYRNYQTTVTFARGTGFIERVRLTTSPWLQEGKRGVYA